MIKVNINKQIGCKTFLFPDKQPHINIDGVKENNEYKLIDKVDWEKESKSELKTVFKDGKLVKEFTLAEIRTNAEC